MVRCKQLGLFHRHPVSSRRHSGLKETVSQFPSGRHSGFCSGIPYGLQLFKYNINLVLFYSMSWFFFISIQARDGTE